MLVTLIKYEDMVTWGWGVETTTKACFFQICAIKIEYQKCRGFLERLKRYLLKYENFKYCNVELSIPSPNIFLELNYRTLMKNNGSSKVSCFVLERPSNKNQAFINQPH